MRARRPRAIRAPDDERTEWFAGGAGSRHPGSQGPPWSLGAGTCAARGGHVFVEKSADDLEDLLSLFG